MKCHPLTKFGDNFSIHIIIIIRIMVMDYNTLNLKRKRDYTFMVI